MQYDRSAHRVHHHRYHTVRATGYRHRVLTGDPGLRVRTVRRQVRRGNGVSILHGALPGDHVHMSVSVPPEPAIPGPVRRAEGRSSRRIRRGLPGIRGRCRGRRFRFRGHFPATTGTITDGPVLGILTVTSLTLPAPAGSYSHHAGYNYTCDEDRTAACVITITNGVIQTGAEGVTREAANALRELLRAACLWRRSK